MPTVVRLGLAIGGYAAVVALVIALVWAKAARVQDQDDTGHATSGRAAFTETTEELPATSGGRLVGSILNSGETLAPGGYKTEPPAELPVPEIPIVDPPLP